MRIEDFKDFKEVRSVKVTQNACRFSSDLKPVEFLNDEIDKPPVYQFTLGLENGSYLTYKLGERQLIMKENYKGFDMSTLDFDLVAVVGEMSVFALKPLKGGYCSAFMIDMEAAV